MRFRETNDRWPFIKAKAQQPTRAPSGSDSESRQVHALESKTGVRETAATVNA